jgi:hypothetical protein
VLLDISTSQFLLLAMRENDGYEYIEASQNIPASDRSWPIREAWEVDFSVCLRETRFSRAVQQRLEPILG